MILATTMTLALMAPLNGWVGCDWPLFRHHKDKAPSGPCCDRCGTGSRAVFEMIVRLQRCRSWKDRDDAAHDLRDVSWKCHPEAVDALAHALLTDCEEEVREEAAESLAKMGPCLPSAHLALKRAAVCDPDSGTRKWARRGLEKRDDKCVETCSICEPGAVPITEPTTFVLPAPPPDGPRLEPGFPVNPALPPPADLPPALPGTSPFAPNPVPAQALPEPLPLGGDPYGRPNLAPLLARPSVGMGRVRVLPPPGPRPIPVRRGY